MDRRPIRCTYGAREGLVRNITFSRPVLLHVHNDAFGEQVTVGTRQVDGSEERDRHAPAGRSGFHTNARTLGRVRHM